MKNLLVVVILLSFGFLNAQDSEQKFLLSKNTWSIGGVAAINYGKVDAGSYENSNFNLSLRPKVSLFVSDNLAAGLQLGYSYSRSRNESFDSFNENQGNAISFSPYVQKYFGITNNLAFNLMGFADYTRTWYDVRNREDFDNSGARRNIYSVGVRPGLTYLLSKKFSLDANIGALQFAHSDYKTEDDIEESNNNFSLALNLSNFYFGITYYIN